MARTAKNPDETSPVEEKEAKSTIKVIVRMTQLLDALAARSGAVHLKDLSLTTGLHPSTAHRILNVMCDQRMVERVDAGSYKLGIRLLELGNLFKQRISVREEALDYMHQLQNETGESVTLSIRHKDEVIFVERAVGSQSLMRVDTPMARGRCYTSPRPANCFWLTTAKRPGKPMPSVHGYMR